MKRENRADLLIHPVRWRILQAFVGGRRMTPREVGLVLADVPRASLYRHINRLAEAGVLHVVEEKQIRGTVERCYALSEQNAVVSPDDIAGASREDHMRYFTMFTTTLLEDFARYLGREHIDLVADIVSYREAVLNATDEEMMQFIDQLRDLVLPMMNNAPAPGRKRRLLATILMPASGHQQPEEIDNPGQQGAHKFTART